MGRDREIEIGRKEGKKKKRNKREGKKIGKFRLVDLISLKRITNSLKRKSFVGVDSFANETMVKA